MQSRSPTYESIPKHKNINLTEKLLKLTGSYLEIVVDRNIYKYKIIRIAIKKKLIDGTECNKNH